MDGFGELAVGAQRGDRAAVDAFFTLVRKELEAFYRTRYSDINRREDAVQTALIVVYKELGSLRDPKCVRGWLRKIAQHIHVDLAGCEERFRPETGRSSGEAQAKPAESGRRRQTQDVPLDELGPDRAPDAEPLDEPGDLAIERHWRRGVVRRVTAVCGTLGLKGSNFLLVHLGERSHAEAVAELGLRSEEQSRVNCCRVMRQIRERLDGLDQPSS